MSGYNEIIKAVDLFKAIDYPFELMHSVQHPSPEDQLNLNIIQRLVKKYNCPVGYGGHEPSVSPSIVAVTLGANSMKDI